jgi:hypothetical protein
MVDCAEKQLGALRKVSDMRLKSDPGTILLLRG